MRTRFLWAPDAGDGGGAAAAAAATGTGTGADDGKSLLDGVKTDAPSDPTKHPADTGGDDAAKAAAAAEAAKSTKPARPDYLPEQFWDAEKGEPRLEAMAKSWKDSRDAINKGAKPPEKPDGYKLTLPEGAPADLVKADDPLLASVRESAHKAGISQAQFDAMAAPVVALMAEAAGKAPSKEALAAAEDERVKGELAQLGPTGEVQVKGLATWVNGLVAKGVLSKEERGALFRAATTAAGVRALAKLRNMGGEQQIPIDASALPDGQGSLEDYYTLMASAKPEDKAKARRILESLDKAGLLPQRPPAGIGIGAR